jgi:hypothetical protein
MLPIPLSGTIDTVGRAFRNPDSDETYNGYKMQSRKQGPVLMTVRFHTLEGR